jgi:hypothetical protein
MEEVGSWQVGEVALPAANFFSVILRICHCEGNARSNLKRQKRYFKI